jgi:drug/metabolite transporter (DMT)-like permease
VFVSLLAALTAAFCYGIGAVMQAIAVRAASRRPVLAAAGVGGRVDPGLVIRMFRQWPFVLSLGIDFAGFVCQLIALRRLPIFEVQVIIAANLAVTAVFASWLMHTVLSMREWAAVISIVVGVGLLGSSAGSEGATRVGIDFHLGLIVALAAIAGGGVAAARLPSQYRTVGLGAMAGLGYAVLAVCARILPGFTPAELIKSPAAYTLAAAGIISFMLYASALESGSVTVATAAVILLETAPPALIGVLFLGDSTKPGLVAPAIAGFIMALVSAIALARFGEAGVQKGAEAQRAEQASRDAGELAKATKLRKAKMLTAGKARIADGESASGTVSAASLAGPMGTVGPGGPNGAEGLPEVAGQVVMNTPMVDLQKPAGQGRGQLGLPSGSRPKTG